MYSDVHRFHIASLHFSKNFTRFLKSLSGNWCAGNLGKYLGLMCSMASGVSTGNWIYLEDNSREECLMRLLHQALLLLAQATEESHYRLSCGMHS